MRYATTVVLYNRNSKSRTRLIGQLQRGETIPYPLHVSRQRVGFITSYRASVLMYKKYCKDLESLQQNSTMSEKEKKTELQELCDNLWKNCSLIQKHLSPALAEKLSGKKTKLGGTLADCIRSGCKNVDSGVGLYACDPEAYTVFEELFYAVIKDYHKVLKVEHPEPGQFGASDAINKIGDLDPEGKFVVSTRVRVGRSHEGFPFPPTCTKEQRLKMEKISKEAFESFEGELKGQYNPLVGMSPEVEKKMIEDHFLFKNDDRFLRDAGGYNDWPEGRGIFFSTDKKFLAWVNEEDHLRFISMQMGGNLGEVYKRLVKAIEHMTKTMKFAKNKNLGYLTFCPTNLGTTMRASVHIKVPLLSSNKERFHSLCATYNLQPRGIHGEHTESVGGVYDISNKRRLGLTEFDALSEMANGIKAIIAEEKKLMGGQQTKK